MAGWHHRLYRHGFGWTLGVGDVQGGLACCNSWGLKQSDTTGRLRFHFSLSCIGEGNGNPLQYPCLENPRDRGAQWAAVCGLAQSRTRLKQLSSSCTMMKKLQELLGFPPNLALVDQDILPKMNNTCKCLEKFSVEERLLKYTMTRSGRALPLLLSLSWEKRTPH